MVFRAGAQPNVKVGARSRSFLFFFFFNICHPDMSCHRAASEAWLTLQVPVAPLDDLRRPELDRISWVPPKIKKRERSEIDSGVCHQDEMEGSTSS